MTTATTAAISISTNSKFERSELLLRLMSCDGLTQIEAAQKIRSFIDQRELVPVEDAGLVTFRLKRNIITTPFERRQRELQESWLNANEVRALQLMQDEINELKGFEKLEMLAKK